MTKSLAELEESHHNHRFATYAVILFIVLLSFTVIFLIQQTQKNQAYNTYRTNASEITRPTPTPPNGPTSQPKQCVVDLKDIAYSGSNGCKTGEYKTVSYTCSNGRVGELNAYQCMQQYQLKDYANQACLFQSTCNAFTPQPSTIIMIKDTSCPKATSKGAMVKCTTNDPSGYSNSWAQIRQSACKTQDGWNNLVSNSDICQSRRTPWTYPVLPTPTYYPTPTAYVTLYPTKYLTPTPPYVTPTPWQKPTWTPTPPIPTQYPTWTPTPAYPTAGP